MLAVHSMNLELGARAFGIKKSGSGVYRPNNNPCFDYFQYKGRSRSNRTLIDRKNVKGMLEALKTGIVYGTHQTMITVLVVLRLRLCLQ